MTTTQLLRIACLTAIALPQLVAAQQGLTMSPLGLLLIAILNVFCGLVLSEMKSSGVVAKQDDLEPLTDDDVQQISDEIERRLKKPRPRKPKAE